VFSLKSSGSLEKTRKYLKAISDNSIFDCLHDYGREGVRLLEEATPIDTGATSKGWTYSVEHSSDRHILSFNNEYIENGLHIAVILQYGHGTGGGGYVEGYDYINPTLVPFFDKIVDEVMRQVRYAVH